ncbi:MAG: septum formation initiator family protein [Acidobacteria bacterium]|uniref:Septum formation initiator family protein n=1 Tax=Candidatus Polarisedimenticola svalbardensis TaxID=2886004 RepID=A0A8J6XTJ9_9BACT|nr:septum formation initiator family protein [Candidatus Polarisedimenticola svalbardensis]
MFYRGQKGNGPGGGEPPTPVPDPVPERESASGPEMPPPYRPSAAPVKDVSRNLVKVLVVTIFVAGLAALVFGEHGLMDVRRSKKELREVRQKVREKRETVARLRAEVNRLESDPMALERVAREQLNLAKPGEYIILLPREPDWGKPPEQAP